MSPKRPTLADVAAGAGVSKAAVSRVINDAPGVAEQTRARVQEVITRLGYRPDPVARALAVGRGEVVELVVVEDAAAFGVSPYYGRVTAGMLQELAGSNLQLQVHLVDRSGVAALLDAVAGTVSVGVVLLNVPAEIAGEFYTRCDRVVSMGVRAPAVPFVGVDNAGGAYAAVRHLFDTGRRRIAALHGPAGHTDADGRREGYRRAVHELGLPDLAATGEFHRDSGYDLTGRLLHREPALDAIFAGSDAVAAGAMQALADAGRRVPDDVAIVGFDDSVIALCTTPPMSSVRQPVEEMAAAAVRALVKRQLAAHWRGEFPAVLRVRRSSGPA
ncbi:MULTISPECIES: LacI family DNA-binding transcriptional regulator [Catenuloplanes]|uniref:DNA-binding LacI/PurR family transcriptional regulator n=1 Tax=Catenuloplanes niger TaxID=587534 RepID=A0AAE3ZIB7_9ACTN|nr:LacI family DNA-binding transcriptional regulator [Catenuloplanes niger]MDR7320479.1 DNA-binding LacI/PurR family transcriptional regulator [Catenuloplanes niger]